MGRIARLFILALLAGIAWSAFGGGVEADTAFKIGGVCGVIISMLAGDGNGGAK
jgi:hypothetical protein